MEISNLRKEVFAARLENIKKEATPENKLEVLPNDEDLSVGHINYDGVSVLWHYANNTLALTVVSRHASIHHIDVKEKLLRWLS